MSKFKTSFILFLFILFLSSVFAQTERKKIELPKLKKGESIICHNSYCFVYSEKHEQSKWIAYMLTSKMLNSKVKRNDKFKIDPLVESETANNKDYSGSGYDRGHLAPAADMCFSTISMQESFYYSNISPQKPGFNRGIWKNLESKTRNFAEHLNKIYIVTGPVLKNGLPEIGENGVDVPEYFYKAILYVSDTCVKAIAFLLPNKKADSDLLYNYAISIDNLEKKTKINFFYQLPYLIEKRAEKNCDVDFWKQL